MFRTRFKPFEKARTVFHGHSMARQEAKDECDVNQIMKRFEKTGQLPDLIKSDPKYGDYSDVPTYQDSLNLVLFSQEQFAALSSRVRERFANDPVKFLDFVSNPANTEEMVRLGLASKVEQAPIPEAPGGGKGGTPPASTSKKEKSE